MAAQLIDDENHRFYNKLLIINQDKNYPNLIIDLNTRPIKTFDKADKNIWDFYILKLLHLLFVEKFLYSVGASRDLSLPSGLVLVYNSDLPTASGVSSSHALILCTLLALTKLLDIQPLIKIFHTITNSPGMISSSQLNLSGASTNTIMSVLQLCQSIEQARGFQSGLGDQAAQLLVKKDKLVFVKLFPELQYQYIDRPENMGIIIAPSFIKADKNLPEFKAANENISIYKSINVNEILAKFHDTCHSHASGNPFYLGDLLYKYSDTEIIDILESIPDHKTKGLALYGLAEGARVKKLKEFCYTNDTDKSFDQEEFLVKLGKHLNKSHEAEKNFRPRTEISESGFYKSWEAIPETEKNNFILDKNLKLSEHTGIYSASTLINDQLQDFANRIPGVYGSSISGAGLGGNNIILCESKLAPMIKDQLINLYYKCCLDTSRDYSKEIHISSSSQPLSVITL